MTKVIYRTFKRHGDVIALFPEIAADRDGNFCLSYQVNGEHAAASPTLPRVTRPATATEAKAMQAILQALGYRDLKQVKRVTLLMHKARYLNNQPTN